MSTVGDAVTGRGSSPHAKPAAVDVSLSLSFDGVLNVLDRVNLRVAVGEFVALVGPSGAPPRC